MRLNSLLFSIVFLSLCSVSNAQVHYRLKSGDVLDQSFFSRTNGNNLILGLNASGATPKINSSLIALDPRYSTAGVIQQTALNPLSVPTTGGVLELIANSNLIINQATGGNPGQVIHVLNNSPTSIIRFTNGSGIYIRGQAVMALGYNEACTMLVLSNSQYSIW
jgi:hypothetical protein